MNSKQWRVFHKWLAILVGVFLLVWTISGIVMVLPNEWFDPAPVIQSGPIDYEAMPISPQEAITALKSILGTQIQVSNLSLKKLQGKLYYGINLAGGGFHLIDASTGTEFKVTEKTAEELVRSITGKEGVPLEIEPLLDHDLLYPFGSLPVFRVKFKDQSGDLYYVSMINSDVTHSTIATRTRAVITSLHTFEPLTLLTQRDSIRKLLLVGSAAIAVFVALTGYILAIQPILRQRAKTKRNS